MRCVKSHIAKVENAPTNQDLKPKGRSLPPPTRGNLARRVQSSDGVAVQCPEGTTILSPTLIIKSQQGPQLASNDSNENRICRDRRS